MKYIGIQEQLRKNNFRSVLLLLSFPGLLIGLLWFGVFLWVNFNSRTQPEDLNKYFYSLAPFVLIGVGIWFLIAWSSHSYMIKKATSSKTLSRKENMRVYNLVENLCMSVGMKTPKIYIIEDDSLNAFASGISESTYAVSFSRGIIDRLDDEELKGVIAHELTHIRNGDVKLMIVSIVFVGVFSFITQASFRMITRGSRKKNSKSGGIILVVLLMGLIGYLLSLLFRFALSRKREYLADAGAVELTKDSKALANALRKITKDPLIEAVEREDVAQMFIEHPTKKEKASFSGTFSRLFATHPPIQDRIQILEQF